jgi:glycosyltransferase involved in cell wall biosynthesis
VTAPPPRITVVTPCLNRADFIADAVESVLDQGYPDVEHIVMDGGSTDGTLDVLARYPHLQVHSGPDAGLYDAINRGVALATGEVIAHLNSDDLFAESAFNAVVEAFAAHPEAQSVAGGADLLARGPDGEWHRVRDYPAARHGRLSLHEITLGIPIVNARFFRREVYARVGGYDLDYPIGADREFLLRVLLAGEPEANIERVLYHYRSHPGSLTMRSGGPHALPRFREYLALTERYAADPAVPSEVRAACRRWHRHAAIDGALEAVRCLNPAGAWGFVARGWRHAPLFPASLAGAVAWRLARRPFKRAA